MVDVSCITGEALDSAIARFDKKTLEPGMFNIHSNDEAYTMVQPSVGAEDAMEDGRAVKLMIANALGLPEYMLSDGQNSNLASSQSQELPVIKKFKDRQEVVERMLRDIFNLAFQHAMEAGLLPKTWKNDEGEFPTDASFITITLGMLEEENFKEKAEPLMKLQSLNLLSKQTVLTELGFDPEQEAKQIEIEAQEEPDL